MLFRTGGSPPDKGLRANHYPSGVAVLVRGSAVRRLAHA